RSGPSTRRRATASCYGELPIAPLVCQKWAQFVGATSTDFGPPPAWIPAAICLSSVPTFSRPMPHFAAALACPGAFADWRPPPETASAEAAKTSIASAATRTSSTALRMTPPPLIDGCTLWTSGELGAIGRSAHSQDERQHPGRDKGSQKN